MSETPEPLPLAETFARPEALLRVPLGMASPLWGLFAGAAVGGSAWWWMTRWTRPENLEALFGAALTAPVGEPLADAVAEAVAEAQAALEAIVEPPELDAPVGGESAPIGPAVAAESEALDAAAPKPRARRTEPRPE
jgi:hypothetical protein